MIMILISINAPAVGAILLIAAVLTGWYSRRLHRRQSVITKTSTTDIGQLSENPVVEVQAEVVDGETFASPIGDTECVLSVWEIDEYDDTGWETSVSGIDARPFILDDGTGQTRVDIEDHVKAKSNAEWEINWRGLDIDRMLSVGVSIDDIYCVFDEFSVEHSVSSDCELPPQIAAFESADPDIPERSESTIKLGEMDLETKGKRRYFEETITPGQEIYLLCEATATGETTHPAGPDDIVLKPRQGDELTIISDQTETDLIADFNQYRWGYAAAGIMAFIGLITFIPS